MNQNFVENFLKKKSDIKKKYHLVKQGSISLDFDNPKLVILEEEKIKNKFISTADCMNKLEGKKPVKLNIRRHITNESFKNFFRKTPDAEKEKNYFLFSKEEQEELKRVSLTEVLNLSRSKSTPYITLGKISSTPNSSQELKGKETSGKESPINLTKKHARNKDLLAIEKNQLEQKDLSNSVNSQREVSQNQQRFLRESIADSGSSSSESEEEKEDNESQAKPIREAIQQHQALVESYGSISSLDSGLKKDNENVEQENLELQEDFSSCNSSSGGSMCEEPLKIVEQKTHKNLNREDLKKKKETNERKTPDRKKNPIKDDECLTIKKRLNEAEKEKKKKVKKRSRHSSDTSVSFIRIRNQRIFEGSGSDSSIVDCSIQDFDLPQNNNPINNNKNKKKMIKKTSRSTQYLFEQTEEPLEESVYPIRRLMSINTPNFGLSNLQEFKEEELNICSVCHLPLSNTQMVACFNICEHQFHEPCLFELIEKQEYKELKNKEDAKEMEVNEIEKQKNLEEEGEDEDEGEEGISTLFCPKCHQL